MTAQAITRQGTGTVTLPPVPVPLPLELPLPLPLLGAGAALLVAADRLGAAALGFADGVATAPDGCAD
jgi:hypothetical protein